MKKRIKVSFNNRFYSLSSIKKGIADYEDVADCVLKKDKNSVTVCLYDFNDELRKHLGNEFANYVLFVEGNRRDSKAAGDR